jgi:hypothetical protein
MAGAPMGGRDLMLGDAGGSYLKELFASQTDHHLRHRKHFGPPIRGTLAQLMHRATNKIGRTILTHNNNLRTSLACRILNSLISNRVQQRERHLVVLLQCQWFLMVHFGANNTHSKGLLKTLSAILTEGLPKRQEIQQAVTLSKDSVGYKGK